MINIIKTITFIIGTILIFKNIIKYIKGENKNITIYVQCVFYFFYYIPLICDVLYKRPVYLKHYYGFIESYKDFTTELIFCIIITYINYLFYYFQKKHVYQIEFKNININTKIISYIIFMVITLILIFVFFKIDAEILDAIFSYNMRYMDTDVAINLKNIAFVIIALALIFILLEDRPKTMIYKIFFMLPFLVFSCLLNGKRASVFMSIVGILMILVLKNAIKDKKKFIIVILMCVVILFGYQSFYNNEVTEGIDDYLAYRVNYGRDDTMKMVIYSELNDDKILEHRGQSLLFYLTFYIPRAVWTEKPYPYATYFTSALVNRDTVIDLGWNMTTSIFDEVLSNFGWFGIIVLPFVMNKILNGIVKRNKGILGKAILFLGIFDMVLLIAVQASAFLLIYIALIALVIVYDLKQKIKKRSIS